MTTKTVSIRHGLGPIQTTDAAGNDDATRITAKLKNSLGLLSAADLAAIQRILQKYGSGGARVDGLGVSCGGFDSARVADNRAGFDAQVQHTRTVADAYTKFWDDKAAQRQRGAR